MIRRQKVTQQSTSQVAVLKQVLYRLSYFTDHASPAWPSLPPLFSSFLKKSTQQKTTGTSRKTFPEQKQTHVGMESSKTNQTRWEWHHNTFIIPTSYAILPTMHTIKHSTCSLKPFCSVAIKLQPSTTQLTLHASQHALHTHTQHYTLHCLPQPSYAHNKHKALYSWQNDTRCREDVKVLWCHSHFVWLVLWGFHSYMRLFRFFVTCVVFKGGYSTICHTPLWLSSSWCGYSQMYV